MLREGTVNSRLRFKNRTDNRHSYTQSPRDIGYPSVTSIVVPSNTILRQKLTLTLMNDPFSFDVFLSHSSNDKAIVRDIAERLRSDGLRVWFDEWEIRVGDNIPARIEYGLENSRVLVLCMSAHAFGSDWAQLEAGTFRFRDPLNKERRFVPLRLDQTPAKGSLAQFLHISWLTVERDQAYPRLLEACRQPLSRPRSARRAASPAEPAERVVRLDYEHASIKAYVSRSDGKQVLTCDRDATVRLWDAETGRSLRVFNGHTEQIWGLAWSADLRSALSASNDKTLRLWDLETGRCSRVFEGHTKHIMSVAFSPDGRQALSGSRDETVRLWDLDTGRTLLLLEGHTDTVWSLAWSADQRLALSGSSDQTVRLWDMGSGRCLRVMEGHTSSLRTVQWSPDQRLALSGAGDGTVRLWDIETGACLRVLEGHSDYVWTVQWSANQRRALSGSLDRTMRLWDLETGRCLREFRTGGIVRHVAWSVDQQRAISGDALGFIRLWDLEGLLSKPNAPCDATSALTTTEQVQYTNAKVLLVGESGAGKTGLTERLSRGRAPQRGPSTSGAWSTQWPLKDLPEKPGWEREVWLWDFGGQADQRLIHQLYLDRTALVLLVFNADQENVLPGLREWHQSLARSTAYDAPKFLVAGRTDVGFRCDRQKVRAFAAENGYEYFETSSETGSGIPELRKAMLRRIPWDELAPHNSPALFKRLKDEILKLRDDGQALVTFKELEALLRYRLPSQIRFADTQLETVVSLLDGPGLVKDLGFGTYILLRPEWLNVYAQSVIRTLRAAESGLGCLPVSSIVEGRLIFQAKRADGEETEEKRLTPAEEKVVLQAMEQMLLERRLCLRQNGDLVFPSHCGLERPVGPALLKFFVSYTIRGFLDDIYATLVVKLAHCGAFKLKELWRDAADFETLAERKIVGVKLVRQEDGRGELLAHHARGVTAQEQVILANYIHEHLIEKSTEEVPRLRFYACPDCDEPVKNRELAMELLVQHGEKAKIRCQRCDKFIPLWDTLERRFASQAVKKEVEGLLQRESAGLDSRRQGQLLVLEVSARITSANQKCHEIPGAMDEGVDMDVEFTDDEGRGTGKHMYLQLKAGNSFLKKRRRDGEEVFAIKKQNWVRYWAGQGSPMMLVIGTFPEESARGAESEKKTFAEVRWMEIGELLRSESDGGKRPVKQILFKGERLDALSVRKWRETVLRRGLVHGK
jgi:small GTP-binding protein